VPAASCEACGSRVPGSAGFCPGCGDRIGADGGVAVSARSRATPATAILVLALLAVGLAALLFVQGHPIAALLLLVAALFQFGLSGEAARQRPDTALMQAADRFRNTGETTAARLRGRAELRRLRRTLPGLRAGRPAPLLALGEAVYHGDAEASDDALLAIRTLDRRIAETEARMRAIETGALLPTRRSAAGPEPVPEPVPEPSPPLEPPLIPEPLPRPSPPPQIPSLPGPAPEPSEPWPAARGADD
jgi:hypothetical protein